MSAIDSDIAKLKCNTEEASDLCSCSSDIPSMELAVHKVSLQAPKKFTGSLKSRIPSEISENVILRQAIEQALPKNYNFEVSSR